MPNSQLGNDVATGALHEALATAAERFGTPLYVYDGTRMRQRLTALRKVLGQNTRVFYSAKANPAVGIVALLTGHGAGLDVCSPGDLELAERAGVSRGDLSYTGYATTAAELRSAIERCATVVVDSVDEGLMLAELVPQQATSIGLRVNPGITAPGHAGLQAGAAEAKFGVATADVGRAVERLRTAGLEIEGFHAHLGGETVSPGQHLALLERLQDLATAHSAAWINLGGGFGGPRSPGDADYDWQPLCAALHVATAQGIEVRLEPGSHLTMDAGWLVTRVTRRTPADAARPTTVQTDASTNLVPSIPLYGARHEIFRLTDTGHDDPQVARITGNLMQAGDVITGAGPDAEPGDLLAIGQVGAYAASRATTFNERPRPAEALLLAGEAVLLRRAENVEELFGRDLPLPDGLR